jgi:hypothetical protein
MFIFRITSLDFGSLMKAALSAMVAGLMDASASRLR